MNKTFKKMLLNYIKETPHTSYKNSKGLVFVEDNDEHINETIDKVSLMKNKEHLKKLDSIPFFFEKYTDYSFSEIQDIVSSNIDLKNHEYANLEEKYKIFKKNNIIRGLVCNGDDVVLYGPQTSRSNESSTSFALQIALAISIGYPVFLCPTQKSKVLYINNSLTNEIFSYILEKQIKGKNNFDKYSESFVPLKLDANYNFLTNKESLKDFINKVNPDIIFFDNMDVIYRSTREKDLKTFIRSISGDRAVVMVYNEETPDIDTIIENSKIVIGLKKDKNSLLLKNKESAFITWGHVYFDYKKLSFNTKELNKSFYPLEEKDGEVIANVKDYGVNPPLP